MKNILSSITLAIFALSPPAHSAVHLSPTDTGSAIIVPFYTVANQMNTLLTLNNTKDETKAVKIHIKEAAQGAVVASFNVYLTPQDMWTFGMGSDNRKLKMISNDASCALGFPNNQTISPENNWLWTNGIIEIIEMGVVNEVEPLNPDNLSCAAVSALWESGGQWFLDNESAMLPATGGLHAEVTLMDVEQGHSANIPVIHMGGFYGEDKIQHTAAGLDIPNLASGTHNSMVIHNGELIETTWPTGYEAISALLMKSTLTNEFNSEPEVLAQTELVISIPTLFYHLNSQDTVAPFDRAQAFWFPYLYRNISFFDRGGTERKGTCPRCDPPPPENLRHSVNNFRLLYHDMGDLYFSSLLSATSDIAPDINAANELWLWEQDYVAANTTNGKISFNLSRSTGPRSENDRGRDSTNSSIMHLYIGLPVVGFTYTKFTNANAQPGLLAQYAFVREHFGEKKIILGDSQ
ncbi:hypothetical protein [Marinicella rhabdoformis]|uniref:hypothetical protein n=1 Tax=Marinicella rhabdoformis TaxID=2580566 RepID=UPI0012AEC1B7|nr:hypothetical protein [Marinicella rhabdoformis]